VLAAGKCGFSALRAGDFQGKVARAFVDCRVVNWQSLREDYRPSDLVIFDFNSRVRDQNGGQYCFKAEDLTLQIKENVIGGFWLGVFHGLVAR
jgi:hypothetical protein